MHRYQPNRTCRRVSEYHAATFSRKRTLDKVGLVKIGENWCRNATGNREPTPFFYAISSFGIEKSY